MSSNIFRKRTTDKFLILVLLVLGIAMSSFAPDANADPITCVAPPSGMIGWWPGDGNADDIVDGNPGTLTGATFATGKVDQGFSLSGSHVLIPDASNLQPQQLTVDAWVLADGSAPIPFGDFRGAVIVSKDLGSPAGVSYALFGPGVTNQFTATIDTLGGRAEVTSANAFAFDQFHHVAMTWDGSELRLYVNGQLEGTHNVGPQAINYDSTDLAIGIHPLFGTRPFTGIIDEVEIFDRALTQSEIQSIVDAGSEGKCKFEDADGDGSPDDIDSNPNAFTAVNSGDWHDPTVWEGGIVPGATDNKEVLTGVTVTIASPVANSGAILDNYGTIRNLGEFLNNFVSTSAIINNYGTFENSGTINNASGRIINFGLFINSGTLGTSGNITNEASGIFNNTVAGTITNTALIENRGIINNYGTLDNSGNINNRNILNNQCAATLINTFNINFNPVNEVLCIPNLISPEDSSTISEPKPDLTWDANNETRPVVYFAILEDTSNPGVPIELVSLSLVSAEPLSDLADGNYQWTVTSYLDASYSPSYPFTSMPVDSATFSFDVLLPATGDVFCDDMTIDQLIASGNYNIIDNRDRHLGKNVKGTNGNDLFLLSDLGDKASARQGDDCVIGGSGNDTIHGGKGNDKIFGQGGNDKISGNQGNDHISGAEGNDKIWGGLGDDSIDAGDGDDKAHGNQGDDVITGGVGNDWLGAGIGDDLVSGGQGDDKIFGRPGADALNGDEGDDKIHGGQGDDSIDGGSGNDQCHGAQGTNTLANCEATNGRMDEEEDESEPEEE